MNRIALPGVVSDILSHMKKQTGHDAPRLADFQALLEGKPVLPERLASGLTAYGKGETATIGKHASSRPALGALEFRLARSATEPSKLGASLSIGLEGDVECDKVNDTGLAPERVSEPGQALVVAVAPIGGQLFMAPPPGALTKGVESPEAFPGEMRACRAPEMPVSEPGGIEGIRPSEKIALAHPVKILNGSAGVSEDLLESDPLGRVSGGEVPVATGEDPAVQPLEHEAVTVKLAVEGAEISPDAHVFAGPEYLRLDNRIREYQSTPASAKTASVTGTLPIVERQQHTGVATFIASAPPPSFMRKLPDNSAPPQHMEPRGGAGGADRQPAPLAIPEPDMALMQQEQTRSGEAEPSPQPLVRRPDALSQMPLAPTQSKRNSGTADDSDALSEAQDGRLHPLTSSRAERRISRSQEKMLDTAPAGPPILAAATQIADYTVTMRNEANPAVTLTLNGQNIATEVAKLSAELAAPPVFRNEAEEIRAELRGRLKSVRIKLQPESLGEVSINVHSLQAGLRVEVRVQNDDAGKALLREIDGIADVLSGMGLAIEQFTLTAPGGGITVVHASAQQTGNSVPDSQSERFRDPPAQRDDPKSPERHKPEFDETNGSKALGIYI